MSDDPRAAAGEVADGSDRSLPAPDLGARDWTRTRTSDATEPPVPVEVAEAQAVQVEAATAAATSAAPAPAVSYDRSPTGAARAPGAPSRPVLLLQGCAGLAVAAVLLGAAATGIPTLLVALLVLQVVVVLSLLSALAAPAAGGAAAVAIAVAVAADAVVLVDDGEVDRVAGVLGLALVAALLHQLVRRGRSRVTESLADTLLAVVVAAAAACLLALAALDGGRELLLVAVGACAAALLVGRLADCLVPRPVLATGATRGWPGLLLGVAAGIGVAVGAGAAAATALSPAVWALVGLATTVTAVTADLAVDLGAAELRPGRRDARRRSALRPAAALLPYAVLGPVVLLAGQLVLS